MKENMKASEKYILMGFTDVLIWWSHARQEDVSDIVVERIQQRVLQGIPEFFDLPREEMYGEFFDIPKPDDVIFIGWFSGGEVFRSGCTFTRGRGKIFYFQPGHEEYPVYHHPVIQQIITNAVHWAKPVNTVAAPIDCIENPKRIF